MIACTVPASGEYHVSAHGHSFLNNGLDSIQWASFISDLHTKLSIINMRIPDFATVSFASFVAVDEPLATCMMVHFWVCFFNDS